MAVMFSNRQEKGGFQFFEKNIDHPQNYEYREWGKFLYFEKNQTHPLGLLMRLIFLVF